LQYQQNLNPLKLERELSQNDRYRDYSPGNIIIKTPSVSFPSFSMEGVQNIFALNDQVLDNHYTTADIHHKLRIDHKLLENRKNAYHIKYSKPVDNRNMYIKVSNQNRIFNTSNYKRKQSTMNSKSTRNK